MIGQKIISQTFKDLKAANMFPRFSLLIGPVGSGRKTLIKEVLGDIGEYQECSIDVETVRNIVDISYRQMIPTLYVFPDADNMSVAAKNALLKVTEEPPNNAFFIMTLINPNNALDTIKSRAITFTMDSYTTKELLDYYHTYFNDNTYDYEVTQYAEIPGDINRLIAYTPDEFRKFVLTVVDNIDKVSGANSFKIGTRLNLSNSADNQKYDLDLFWQAFLSECYRLFNDDKDKTNKFKWIKGVQITSASLAELLISGINKQMAFDNWLLSIRAEWLSREG